MAAIFDLQIKSTMRGNGGAYMYVYLIPNYKTFLLISSFKRYEITYLNTCTNISLIKS